MSSHWCRESDSSDDSNTHESMDNFGEMKDSDTMIRIAPSKLSSDSNTDSSTSDDDNTHDDADTNKVITDSRAYKPLSNDEVSPHNQGGSDHTQTKKKKVPDADASCNINTQSRTKADTRVSVANNERTVASKNANHQMRPAGASNVDNYSDIDMITDAESLASGMISRPDNLMLQRGSTYSQKFPTKRRNSDSPLGDNLSRSSSTEALIEAVTSTPLQTQGTLTEDGDMMSFIAEDLNEKIRISSPLGRIPDLSWAGSQTPGGRSVGSFSSSASGWSASSASGWSALSTSGMSRPLYGNMLANMACSSPSVVTQSPEDIPPIDPRVVNELEIHARRVAENLDKMTANMHSNLHKMSAITATCLETYKDSVDYTCDSMDACIKSMYAMMAKCEELSTTMKPIYAIAIQIKEIKRLLDLFESNITRDAS